MLSFFFEAKQWLRSAKNKVGIIYPLFSYERLFYINFKLTIKSWFIVEEAIERLTGERENKQSVKT